MKVTTPPIMEPGDFSPFVIGEVVSKAEAVGPGDYKVEEICFLWCRGRTGDLDGVPSPALPLG